MTDIPHPIENGTSPSIPVGETPKTDKQQIQQGSSLETNQQIIATRIEKGGKAHEVLQEIAVTTEQANDTSRIKTETVVSPKEEALLLQQALGEFLAVSGNTTKLSIADGKLLETVQPLVTRLRQDNYTREIDPRPVIRAADEASAVLSPQLRVISEESQRLGIANRQAEDQIRDLLQQVASTTGTVQKVHHLQQALMLFQTTVAHVETARLNQKRVRNRIQDVSEQNLQRSRGILVRAQSYLGRDPSRESAPGSYYINSGRLKRLVKESNERVSVQESVLLADNNHHEENFRRIIERLTGYAAIAQEPTITA